jgi:hypothetical protein
LRIGNAVKINPQEAEIIKRIYALAGNRYTGRAIADELNRFGYKKRNGKPWTQRQVCGILQHAMLYHNGFLHYGKTFGGNSTLTILAKNSEELKF